MKVKYLAALTAASILSLGLVTSCATPCAGETQTSPDAGTTEVEPGAGTEPGTEAEPEAGQ